MKQSMYFMSMSQSAIARGTTHSARKLRVQQIVVNSSRKTLKLFAYSILHRKHKNVVVTNIIPPHWHDKDNWNRSLFMRGIYQIYIVNIMDADVLGTQGVRLSATIDHEAIYHYTGKTPLTYIFKICVDGVIKRWQVVFTIRTEQAH